MHFPSLAMFFGLTEAVIVASAGLAAAQSCDQLWYERNSIYKQEGYCFKTQRAIAAFGNAGCMYDLEDQVPLSPGDRARIAAIVQMERTYGCR
jgi:hypothetical protein